MNHAIRRRGLTAEAHTWSGILKHLSGMENLSGLNGLALAGELKETWSLDFWFVKFDASE